MDTSCLVSTFQAAGGVMVWRIFSWHTLGPLVSTEHCLNTTAKLSNAAESDHAQHLWPHLLMPTFSRKTCHKSQIISNWFLQHYN